MKRTLVIVSVVCFSLFGLSEKVMAGAAPLSARESAQLNELAANSALLGLKAGASFPGLPRALEATESSSLRTLEAATPQLASQKAGDGAVTVLVWVVVICLSVLLLRAVGIL